MIKKTTRRPRRKFTAPRVCFFCDSKKEPSFWETGNLQKFVTERGKIIPRSRNGLCARHQNEITSAIKQARYLALIPFISR